LRHADLSDPKELVGEVLADVADFRVGSRTDDVTLVALHRSADRAASGHGPTAIDTVNS